MNGNIQTPPVVILMVDDNPGDVRLVRDFFKASTIANDFHAVDNGEEALAFLRREGSHAHAPRPNLILLDLNLPRQNGQEVLIEIKNDPALKTIPTIVFTVCEDSREISDGYHRYANCLICKPFQYEAYIKVLTAIEDFWLRIVSLPPHDKPATVRQLH